MNVLYDAFGENTGIELELERLEAQAALSWEAEARRLACLTLPAAPRILELGSGPGFVTDRLAALFPDAEIIALDHDPRLLELARARNDDRRVTHVQADAAGTGLPAASFDLILSRYLLQHLDPPEPMLHEALRLLRPGGVHAVIEVDDGLWGLAEPSYQALAGIYAKAVALQQADGRDRFAGRHLHSLLTRAGYADVLLDAFCYTSDALGLGPFLPQLDPSRLMPMVRDGRLPLSDLMVAQACVEQFKATPDARVILIGFIATGRKMP